VIGSVVHAVILVRKTNALQFYNVMDGVT